MTRNKIVRFAGALLSVLATASFGTISTASAAEKSGIHVTGVRVYPGGNVHIDFSASLNATCGGRIRAEGVASKKFVSLATAALITGRAVDVGSTDTKNGNFCDLVYLKLQ